MKPSQPNRRSSPKRGGKAAKFELTRRAWSSQDLHAVQSVARRSAGNRVTSLLAKACNESHGAGRAKGEGHAGASQGAARNEALARASQALTSPKPLDPNKAAPKGEALREPAPVPSFDERRSRPTRASPFSRKRVAAAVSAVRATTLRAKAREGAHRSSCDGTSEGSASGRASGRQRPRARSRGACPTIGSTDRPDPEAHGAP